MLRSGGGELPPVQPDGLAVVLVLVEALWWNRGVDQAVVAHVLADPDLRVCLGLELLHHRLHQQLDVEPVVLALEEVPGAHAKGLALYGRAVQARAARVDGYLRMMEEAVALLADVDPWAAEAVGRDIALGRLPEGGPVLPGAPLSSRLAPDIWMASLCTSVPTPTDDLLALQQRLARTGPRRTASRVGIALAVQVLNEEGLLAAETWMLRVLQDAHASPAQRSIPSIYHALALLMRRSPAATESVLALRPHTIIQGEWVDLAHAWSFAQRGVEPGRVSRLVDGMVRRAQTTPMGPVALTVADGLERDAPQLADRLNALRGQVLAASGQELTIPPAARIPVGSWDVLHPLSAGAQGAVWTAERRHSRESAIVKWLPPGSSRAQQVEMRSLGSLDHPHVVRIHDVLVADEVVDVQSGSRIEAGSVGLVMPRACGSLADRPVQPQEVRPVVEAVLSALAHVHSRGILHLDIKESNLLWSEPAASHLGVWLADFGVANPGWGHEADVLAGTRGYMPPEQERGQLGQVGPWSDLFALGRVVERWAAGASWLAWIRWLLDPDPAGRPSSALEALEALPHDVPDTVGDRVALAENSTFQFDVSETVDVGFIPDLPTRRLPTELPGLPVVRKSGWSGLLAWRRPQFIERGPELEGLWRQLVDVGDQGQCAVVRMSGVGRGRRRLLAELVERATMSGACVARSMEMGSSTDVMVALVEGSRRTPLAGVIRHVMERTDDPVEVVARMAEATLQWPSPGLLVVHSRHLRIREDGPLVSLVGHPGKLMVVTEDACGVELPRMPVDALATLGQRLAGLTDTTALELAKTRDGCPGWLVSTLGVLERSGRLDGPLGKRTISGPWSMDRMGTLRAQLALGPTPRVALKALMRLQNGELADPRGVEHLLGEGLVRMIRGQPEPVDSWYVAPVV